MQRPVQEVGAGVVGHDREATVEVHARGDPLGEGAVADDLPTWRTTSPIFWVSVTSKAKPSPLDRAPVAHLAAGLGVEGGAIEHQDLAVVSLRGRAAKGAPAVLGRGVVGDLGRREALELLGRRARRCCRPCGSPSGGRPRRRPSRPRRAPAALARPSARPGPGGSRRSRRDRRPRRRSMVRPSTLRLATPAPRSERARAQGAPKARSSDSIRCAMCSWRAPISGKASPSIAATVGTSL